jgi:hypothetical protein
MLAYHSIVLSQHKDGGPRLQAKMATIVTRNVRYPDSSCAPITTGSYSVLAQLCACALRALVHCGEVGRGERILTRRRPLFSHVLGY